MTQISKEYATALFDLAKEQGEEEQIAAELVLVQEVFAEATGTQAFLASPALPMQVRLHTLEQAFAEVISKTVLSFLCVLCKQGHVNLFAACAAEYQRLCDESRHTRRATVTSAVPLSEAEREKLKTALERKLQAHLEIDYCLDPTLIGGMKVEAGGTVLDGSLAGKLKTIKEEVLHP